MSYITGIDITGVYTNLEFAAGTIAQMNDGKLYKFVKYSTAAGGIAAVSGNVTYYRDSETVVTSDLSDSTAIGSGVLQSTPAAGEYCWIQIKGFATLNLALTAGADGNALTPVGSTDGALDVSAAVTDSVCAYAFDASAKEIFCDFPY